MFNFFNEIKKKGNIELLNEFNMIDVSGKLLYVEGHMGLTVMTQTMIAFKIKNGRVVVEGNDLFLNELTDNTMLIKGEILKTEKF